MYPFEQQASGGGVIIAKNHIIARGLTAGDFYKAAPGRAGVFNHHHTIRALRQHAAGKNACGLTFLKRHVWHFAHVAVGHAIYKSGVGLLRTKNIART